MPVFSAGIVSSTALFQCDAARHTGWLWTAIWNRVGPDVDQVKIHLVEGVLMVAFSHLHRRIFAHLTGWKQWLLLQKLKQCYIIFYFLFLRTFDMASFQLLTCKWCLATAVARSRTRFLRQQRVCFARIPQPWSNFSWNVLLLPQILRLDANMLPKTVYHSSEDIWWNLISVNWHIISVSLK